MITQAAAARALGHEPRAVQPCPPEEAPLTGAVDLTALTRRGAWHVEGTYTERFPEVTNDADGMRLLFRRFSARGGIPSHVSVTTPGSIHEGGDLGYVLTHAFGAVLDNPDLITPAVVGDGEAETGPLEESWKCISFPNPARDGAVLPVLHLDGAKIAGPPCSAARIAKGPADHSLLGAQRRVQHLGRTA